MTIKLELGGIIPAKPEGDTIFEESFTEKETFGILHDFDEWAKERTEEHLKLDKEYIDHSNVFDRNIALFMSKHFVGFMTKPACLIDGIPILSKTWAIEDIDEIKNFKPIEEGKHYLYDITYHFPRYVMVKADPTTFEPILLDEPELISGYWIIRYGTLDIGE